MTGERREYDELAVERDGRLGRDGHAADGHVLCRARQALTRALGRERNLDVALDARMPTLLHHGGRPYHVPAVVPSAALSPRSKPRSKISALALVPLGVALTLAPLMLPHATAPVDVPLPAPDLRTIERTEAGDRETARRAAAERLPDDARLLGQAIRDFNVGSAHDDATMDFGKARRTIDGALATLLQRPDGTAQVLGLRAYQLERFLDAVRAFERTGENSAELDELGGAFVRRMRLAGWCRDHTVLLPEHVRRVAFKLVWNATVQVEGKAGFEPTLDELRVLYTFYLLHPHAPEAVRAQLDARRAAAKGAKDCAALDAGERLAAEAWRLEKVDRFAKLDPTYPAGFARGVLLYRLSRYDDAARAFDAWLREHPSGALALRAEGHLRAARALRDTP